jgi:hypothetical protein
MKYRKRSIRVLFFVFLLACLLTGLAGAGIARVPARAAPQMQATACVGTTITQWTFAGDVITPSTGFGTFSVGTGLPATTFAVGSPDRAVSYNSWPSALDTSAYIELSVPTLGRNSIGIAFDYRSTGAGPTTLEFHYSVDGVNFTLFNSPVTLNNNGAFHALQFDLSTITGLDNNSSATFRLYGYGATATNGTLRLDNITLTGNCLFPANTDTPSPTGTAVPPLTLLINEVAWAGTAASTSDEWIELYNPGSNPVNLAGWILKADDNSPNIALSGTISAGGYFLLERTDDTTVSDITADFIFTGELNNSNEILRLLDPGGNVVDTANSDGGTWPGNSTTLGSLERRGVIADSETAWITNTGVVRNGRDANNNPINGTPKQPNWALTVTPTASLTPSRTRTPLPTPTNTRTPTPLPPPPLIAINEFVPRPGHDWNGDGMVNVDDEYIELLNHGVVDVNLGGYSLDDEVNIGSNPYRLPSVILKPGERMVFFGSETGLLLSDGGDGVRLLKPNGQLGDAYNYQVVRYPDHTYCRYPDNGGADDWNTNCFPTPGLQNSLSGSFTPPQDENGAAVESLCPLSDTQPSDFIWAECQPLGQNIFRPAYWDKTGWFGERSLPASPGKWPVFVD